MILSPSRPLDSPAASLAAPPLQEATHVSVYLSPTSLDDAELLKNSLFAVLDDDPEVTGAEVLTLDSYDEETQELKHYIEATATLPEDTNTEKFGSILYGWKARQDIECEMEVKGLGDETHSFRMMMSAISSMGGVPVAF